MPSFLPGRWGWLGIWRPIGIYLYDCWPLRREGRMYARLSRMPVEVLRAGESGGKAQIGRRLGRAPSQSLGVALSALLRAWITGLAGCRCDRSREARAKASHTRDLVQALPNAEG